MWAEWSPSTRDAPEFRECGVSRIRLGLKIRGGLSAMDVSPSPGVPGLGFRV